MKLIRFGNSKSEKPGILADDGNRFDVSNFLSDYDENFFESDGIKKLKEWFLKNKNSFNKTVFGLPTIALPIENVIILGSFHSDRLGYFTQK